jgi:hypothetical protein
MFPRIEFGMSHVRRVALLSNFRMQKVKFIYTLERFNYIGKVSRLK